MKNAKERYLYHLMTNNGRPESIPFVKNRIEILKFICDNIPGFSGKPKIE